MTNTQHIPLDAEHYQLVDLCNTKTDELEKTQAINAELLEALKTLCDPDWYRVDPVGFAQAQEKARAAIAKATLEELEG